jgi:deoxyribodipyrimidine photo-lyase
MTTHNNQLQQYMSFEKTLFIFTRDLRLYDNTTLNYVLSCSKQIIPIFVFTPEQIDDTNKYKSNNCVQFMCESLVDLNDQLNKCRSRLFYFYGKIKTIVEKFVTDYDIDSIAITYDYTPFALKRQNILKKICEENKCEFISLEDYILTEHKVKPYVKFTPFFNTAIKLQVRKPINGITAVTKNKFVSKSKKFKGEITNINKFYEENEHIAVRGGRTNALKILKKIHMFGSYNEDRDMVFKSNTMLSAYLKFNVVSIREVYYAMKDKLGIRNELIKQLFWRDFYMLLLEQPEQTRSMKWASNAQQFKKWCNGMTGIPIIDAGMRELNMTGFMHNRARMCVATFLIKILHINWEKGEQYFASKLVDYSYDNNNGGCKWSAGISASSQQFFRCFNYFTQSKKYDSDCTYIKKWIPELRNVPIKDIHNWNIAHSKHKTYIKPMIDDFGEALKIYIKMYKSGHRQYQ